MEPFDEYMDHDALSCIDDYNRYEENQLALDNDFETEYYQEDEYPVSDDNWACGTLEVE